ncbi:hypothetical protein J6590_019482 [Homalodisca vitripennis]|nr:hypothetical protein J6590_019482 [Homalodisca vitripennis]
MSYLPCEQPYYKRWQAVLLECWNLQSLTTDMDKLWVSVEFRVTASPGSLYLDCSQFRINQKKVRSAGSSGSSTPVPGSGAG